MLRSPGTKRVLAAGKGLSLAGYLQKILTSSVYEVAIETPLELAPNLSNCTGNSVFLKREDSQPVFSFKLRGAFNKMAQLSRAELKRGVICASAGNHAQGVALGAKRLGCKATIVMPVTTPKLKIDAVSALGGRVVLHGDSYSDAFLFALGLEARRGATFVHPFDDPDVIAGQGTVAMEILRQHQGPLDAVFVAIGGGGLISGIAAYIKAVRPEIKVIGVQTKDSDAMLRSVTAGRRVQLKDVGLFSDGTAVKLVGKETFRLTRQLVDDFVVVDTDAVCAAIKDVFEDTRSILEPAGALGVAAIKQYASKHRLSGRAFATVTGGANMNFDRLRFVAERADGGLAREALFAVTIPEQRGSFKRLCQVIGNRAVTEFNYRVSGSERAHVFVGVAISGSDEARKIERSLTEHGFQTLPLSDDDLAKQHIRHLVGGHSALSADERLYRFIFPERAGALLKFLAGLPPSANISLFHYRNQGADYGRVLVGIQAERREFQKFLAGLDYPFEDETNNPAYRLFLR